MEGTTATTPTFFPINYSYFNNTKGLILSGLAILFCLNATCQVNLNQADRPWILNSASQEITEAENSYDSSMVEGYAAGLSADATRENMQWTKYHSPSGGHGIAAEDGNALYERIAGHDVRIVGRNNAKNGPDLIIDGEAVQVKYYNNAYSTLESCFDENGIFRYSDQVIMVPKDQYEEAVERMRQKIADGKVPGVSDPNQAENLIRKGNLTYEQSLKLRKALTVESLAFDVVSQAKVAGFVGGLSAAYSFISAKQNGATTEDAFIAAGKEFGSTGLTVLGGGVATQQFLRTQVGRNTAAAVTKAVRKGVQSASQTKVGKWVVEKIALGVTGKELYGTAARTVATKTITGNVITGSAMYVVDSAPDTYRLVSGEMSGKEFAKSRAEAAGGVIGGSAGYLVGMSIGAATAVGSGAAACAIAGGTIGTTLCPGAGTAAGGMIGGIIGGVVGGIGGSAAVKKLTSLFD